MTAGAGAPASLIQKSRTKTISAKVERQATAKPPHRGAGFPTCRVEIPLRCDGAQPRMSDHGKDKRTTDDTDGTDRKVPTNESRIDPKQPGPALVICIIRRFVVPFGDPCSISPVFPPSRTRNPRISREFPIVRTFPQSRGSAARPTRLGIATKLSNREGRSQS